MTAFLRNTLLAVVAMSALTGSALADDTVKSCAKTNLDNLWSGHCCAGDSTCMGGHGRGGNHDNGGRGSTNGAGKY